MGKAAPATPMEGGGGKLLARISLAPGSLAGSLVGNNRIVAAAATTASPSTATTGSTATSRTRASTAKTRVSTTKVSTAKTRVSTTKTTGGASATIARLSAIRTGTLTVLARGETTLDGLGATPPAGTTTAATSRIPRGSQTTPGLTMLAAIKVDENFVV